MSTVEESASPAPQREPELVPPSRNWRPSKRSLAVTTIAGLVIIGLIIGGVTLADAIRKENEAKDAAVAIYEGRLEKYTSSADQLEASITQSEKVLLQVGGDTVDDATVLPDLQSEVDSAKAVVRQAEAKQLDTDSESRDSVEAATAKLAQQKSKLDTATGTLDEARRDVATAKEAKEERIAAEAAAAKTAAEAAAREAAGPIGYEELFRADNSLIGNYYRFEGEIIQDAGGGTYRVNMTKDPGYSRVFWKDTILVTIIGTTGQRLLEDDIISFTASSLGVQTYTTVFGGSVTVPSVLAGAADVAVTGRSE